MNFRFPLRTSAAVKSTPIVESATTVAANEIVVGPRAGASPLSILPFLGAEATPVRCSPQPSFVDVDASECGERYEPVRSSDHRNNESVQVVHHGSGQHLAQRPSWFRTTTYTALPAFRSLTLLDAHDRIYASTANLYLDGGGALAFAWEWRQRDGSDDGTHKVAHIADEDIVGCLVNGIWSTADWALSWCGASGDATLLVQLYAPNQYPMTLWQYRAAWPDRLDGARDLTTDTGLVTTTLSLPAIHASGTDLLLTAKRIAADLEMTFGVLGPPQIDRTGSVRWRYF